LIIVHRREVSGILAEELDVQIRLFGDAALPTLVYLPGLHGDWTLVTGFRLAIANRVRFVDVTYPRRLDWSVKDYADAIETGLLRHGIERGWLLGESWGSQPAWALTGRALQKTGRFEVHGLILAGGFVKHPWKRGPGALKWIGANTPQWLYQFELAIFRAYAWFRHAHTQEVRESMRQFAARRTELDRECMRQRLDLLADFDPRDIARQTRIPVHYLAGFADPLVPWQLVRWWLRKHCPGYRGGRTFWLSDHNVLSCCPKATAAAAVKWMTPSATAPAQATRLSRLDW
jgi:pimeloyl-ACP methyl ester carboxylesterase